jgi:hypothetical protein
MYVKEKLTNAIYLQPYRKLWGSDQYDQVRLILYELVFNRHFLSAA